MALPGPCQTRTESMGGAAPATTTNSLTQPNRALTPRPPAAPSVGSEPQAILAAATSRSAKSTASPATCSAKCLPLAGDRWVPDACSLPLRCRSPLVGPGRDGARLFPRWRPRPGCSARDSITPGCRLFTSPLSLWVGTAATRLRHIPAFDKPRSSHATRGGSHLSFGAGWHTTTTPHPYQRPSPACAGSNFESHL